MVKRCATCNFTTMNPKYKPNCARCHFYLHPDDPRIRNYKVKEHAFMLGLQKHYPEMILDRAVSGGCSRRRPDGLIDCLTHSIIVEIDEDQHVGYETMCDNRRTMELFDDLGRRPIVFIRLNPDKYLYDGKTFKGCFQPNTSGGLRLMKDEFAHRFDILQTTVNQHIANAPEREITYVKLFYSEDGMILIRNPNRKCSIQKQWDELEFPSDDEIDSEKVWTDQEILSMHKTLCQIKKMMQSQNAKKSDNWEKERPRVAQKAKATDKYGLLAFVQNAKHEIIKASVLYEQYKATNPLSMLKQCEFGRTLNKFGIKSRKSHGTKHYTIDADSVANFVNQYIN